jgi:hypothetical protein
MSRQLVEGTTAAIRDAMKTLKKHEHQPPLTGDDPCGLGIHTDTKLRDVPIGFFEWMVRMEEEKPLTLHRSKQWIRVIDYIRTFK